MHWTGHVLTKQGWHPGGDEGEGMPILTADITHCPSHTIVQMCFLHSVFLLVLATSFMQILCLLI